MKTLQKIMTTATLLVAGCVVPQKQSINDIPTSLVAETTAKTKYIARGFTFVDNPVVQESVTATHGNLELGVFGSYDARLQELHEIDLTGNYTFSLTDNLRLNTGYGYFAFPTNPLVRTQEVNAKLSLDVFLNPSLKYVHDFDRGTGNYLEAGFRQSIPLGNVSPTIEAKLGFNNDYFREGTGMSHTEWSLSLPLLIRGITVNPTIGYSQGLDNNFKDEAFGSLAFSVKF